LHTRLNAFFIPILVAYFLFFLEGLFVKRRRTKMTLHCYWIYFLRLKMIWDRVRFLYSWEIRLIKIILYLTTIPQIISKHILALLRNW